MLWWWLGSLAAAYGVGCLMGYRARDEEITPEQGHNDAVRSEVV